MADLPTIQLYTDGSCFPNPGSGGWAALLIHNNRTKLISDAVMNTTSNRMELQAIIEALSLLKTKTRVRLFTDSQYAVGLMRGNTPRTNTDLASELLQIARKHIVTPTHLPGHRKDTPDQFKVVHNAARLAAQQLHESISKRPPPPIPSFLEPEFLEKKTILYSNLGIFTFQRHPQGALYIRHQSTDRFFLVHESPPDAIPIMDLVNLCNALLNTDSVSLKMQG